MNEETAKTKGFIHLTCILIYKAIFIYKYTLDLR